MTLTAAWERWDQLCAAQAAGKRVGLSLATAADRLEDEVQAAATALGVTGSELRRRIVALRIQGATAADAIESVYA